MAAPDAGNAPARRTRMIVEIDVQRLYGERARLDALPEYERAARERAGEGNTVVLTGPGPIWLYLRLAHALHGVARKLVYRSPVTDAALRESGAEPEIVVFDHSPL